MEDYPGTVTVDLGLHSHQQQTEHIGHSSTRKRTRPRSDRGEPGTLRTAVACHTCRERKTRCSGEQPACNYCRRNGIDCVYNQSGTVKLNSVVSNSSSNFDGWGNKILVAIDHLAARLENQTVRRGHKSDIPPQMRNINEDEGSSSVETESSFLIFQFASPNAVTSVSSILSWPVFRTLPDGTSPSITTSGSIQRSQKRGQESASTATSHLTTLSSAFVAHYASDIPILDVTEVESYIIDIGENGAGWDARSCLVFLVAALGCICQRSQESIKLGSRYWNMAKKRLGWVFEEESLLSARCLVLAGMWYLHNGDSRNAWTTLHNATLVIETSISQSLTYDDGLNLQENLQQLQEICLRLQCKLQTAYQHMSSASTQNSLKLIMPREEMSINSSSEISLAARKASLCLLQLRQDTLIVCTILKPEMSWRDASALNIALSALRRRLIEWHEHVQVTLGLSLAESSIPDVSPEELYRSSLLNQYLEVKELILRPWLFVRLYINNDQSAVDSENHAMDEAMNAYFLTKSEELIMCHREAVISRLNIELHLWRNKSSGSLEGPWLQARNLFELALLLVAIKRHISESTSTDWIPLFLDIEQSFRAPGSSDLEKQYADLLHTLVFEQKL